MPHENPPESPQPRPRRGRWRRRALWLLATLGLLVALLFAFRGAIIEAVVQRALDRVASHFGISIHADIASEGWSKVTLSEVVLGPAERPLLTVERVEVEADLSELWSRRLALTRVAVHHPALVLEGDGTPKGAWRAFRQRLWPYLITLHAGRLAKQREAGEERDEPFFDTRYAIKHPPPITVTDVSVEDTGGAVSAHLGEALLTPDAKVQLSDLSTTIKHPRLGVVRAHMERAEGARGAPVDLGLTEVEIGGPLPKPIMLQIEEARVELGGQFSSRIHIDAPALGPCSVVGDLRWAHVRCDRPIGIDGPRGLRLTGDRLTFERDPAPYVRLPGLRVDLESGAHPLLAQLAGAEMELTAGALADAEGRRPFELEMVLKAGSRIWARGSATRAHARAHIQAESVDLPDLLPTEAGTADLIGRLDVVLPATPAGALDADLTLDTRAVGVEVSHPALAEGPVGPFGFALSGEGHLHVPKLSEPRRLRLSLGAPLIALEGPEGVITAEAVGKLDLTDEAPVIYLKGDTGRLDAAKLPGSMPPGLTPLIADIGLKGRFGLRGRLFLDLADPANLGLRLRANTRRLRVTRMPSNMRIERLRSEFTTRFEMPDGTTLSRAVGPATDRWVPLDQIPPLMPIAVMAQEDGGFMKHGGISMFHLRESLGQNLSKGRFFRGGSTLTMQLARNLYLNHRKTLSRKLQELVVAWLLEQSLSKQEMLALYLNVVEFGPDVFGIREGARHYFDKEPLELTTVETIFMVRLLPGPRLYHEQFVKKKLTRGFRMGIKRLMDLLIKRGQLDPLEAISRSEDIVLW